MMRTGDWVRKIMIHGRRAILLFCLAGLFSVWPLYALDRASLTFYLPCDGDLHPAIAPANTEVKLTEFTLPSRGSFKAQADEDPRYLNPADKSPRQLEFVPGRRGQALKVSDNPTRFKVYSYPCVQYVARECFARKEGTIAVWLKPVGWSGEPQHYFIAVTADNCTMRFYTYPGNTYVWLDGPDRYTMVSGGDWHGWKDGEWAFLAFTYKPGRQCFYINGQLMMKSTDGLIEPEFINTGLIEISEGDHVIDDLMIFDQPLSPAEITALYRANSPEKE
ncbi:MAG: LamG domain-containing protein [Armatimonadetes bacterium]|nr:LamG domain-containing protein [Armatimonadota bacterium]